MTARITLAQYDEVVHRIYDAAIAPSQWERVVGDIARLFEASRALIFTWAHTPAQGGFLFTHNISQASLEYWAAKSIHEDPFVRAGVAKGRNVDGTANLDTDLVAQEVLLQTPFYKELWAPMDIARLCNGVIFDGTDAHKLPTFISLFRPLRDPPFLREHADLLSRLLAHLSRSMGVMFHLRDQQLQIASNLAALDRLKCGVMLIDATRDVRFANKAAESLLRQGETVQMGTRLLPNALRTHLNPRLASVERRFQDALVRALLPLSRDATEHFSEALLLPGSDGRPACAVHVAPLPESHGFATTGATARAIVFLYDLQAASSVDPQVLCRIFDLTPAEALAALQITTGGTVEDMASRLGVSVNTFKTQLQAAYMKTGTHRQADLLKLLLSLASA
jgi:DNA-binding CsgD family transcriptional regulator/PAS domain-containing protein